MSEPLPVQVGERVSDLAGSCIEVADDALVVHCAAEGLKQPGLVPIWGPEAITVQPVRSGFPCFGAAITGYVEATRDDDAVKNTLCAPSSYGNTLADWARMNVLGMRNAAAFGSEPDIKAWSDRVALNPARIPPEHGPSPELDDAVDRLRENVGPGLTRLVELSR
jgi:hypothetical protein